MLVSFEEILRYAKIKKYHNNDDKSDLIIKVDNAISKYPVLKNIVNKLINCDMSKKELKNIKNEYDRFIKNLQKNNNNISDKPVISFSNEELNIDEELSDNNINNVDSLNDSLLNFEDDHTDQENYNSKLDDMEYHFDGSNENLSSNEPYTDKEQEDYTKQFIDKNNNDSLLEPTVDFNKKENEDDLLNYDNSNDLNSMFEEKDDMTKGYEQYHDNNRPKVITFADANNNKGFSGVLLLGLLCALSGLIIAFINMFAK